MKIVLLLILLMVTCGDSSDRSLEQTYDNRQSIKLEELLSSFGAESKGDR